jgi:hypothetical protein
MTMQFNILAQDLVNIYDKSLQHLVCFKTRREEILRKVS